MINTKWWKTKTYVEILQRNHKGVSILQFKMSTSEYTETEAREVHVSKKPLVFLQNDIAKI